MGIKTLVKKWFQKWEEGDYLNLPISENFQHVSPYGTINGKQSYINLIAANKEKFLGHRFEVHDVLYKEDKACARYTAIHGDFALDVSEWYFSDGALIEQIVSYYNIEGNISDERKLSNPEEYEKNL